MGSAEDFEKYSKPKRPTVASLVKEMAWLLNALTEAHQNIDAIEQMFSDKFHEAEDRFDRAEQEVLRIGGELDANVEAMSDQITELRDKSTTDATVLTSIQNTIDSTIERIKLNNITAERAFDQVNDRIDQIGHRTSEYSAQINTIQTAQEKLSQKMYSLDQDCAEALRQVDSRLRGDDSRFNEVVEAIQQLKAHVNEYSGQIDNIHRSNAQIADIYAKLGGLGDAVNDAESRREHERERLNFALDSVNILREHVIALQEHYDELRRQSPMHKLLVALSVVEHTRPYRAFVAIWDGVRSVYQ